MMRDGLGRQARTRLLDNSARYRVKSEKGMHRAPIDRGGFFMPVIRHGLAYNDVLLIPRYSRVRSRNEVDLSTVIAPGIALSVPLLSANMDTVTGAEMAIAMDRLGGIGAIGRFDAPEVQARTVQRVSDAGALHWCHRRQRRCTPSRRAVACGRFMRAASGCGPRPFRARHRGD